MNKKIFLVLVIGIVLMLTFVSSANDYFIDSSLGNLFLVNGTTGDASFGYNVSAAEDFCISGGNCLSSISEGLVDGSGSANRAAFWTDSDTLSYDGNFAWDNTNKRLGIGTDSPGVKLDVKGGSGSTIVGQFTNSDYVSGSAGSRLRIQFGSATGNTYTKLQTTDAGGNSASNLILQSDSGNVGIGTDSPDGRLTIKKDVDNSANIAADSSATVLISNNDEDGTPTLKFVRSSAGSYTTDDTGRIVFGTGTGDADDELNIVSRLNSNKIVTFKGDGNVGIGTDSPSSRLSIKGGTSGTSDTLSIFSVTDNTEQVKLFWSDSSGGNVILTDNSGTDKIQLKGTGTSYFNGGNLGIGTSNPGALLHVSVSNAEGTPSLSNAVAVFQRAATSASDSFVSILAGSAGKARLTFGDNASQTAGQLYWDNALDSFVIPSGNVGIGTTSPGAKLDIIDTNKAINSKGNLFVSTSDAVAIDKGGQISLGGKWVTASDNVLQFAGVAGRKEVATSGNGAGYLQLSTTDSSGGTLTEKMRITSTGNVGIGTTSPRGKLDVAGGDIYFDNNTFLRSEYAGYGSENIYDAYIWTNANARIDIDTNNNAENSIFSVTKDNGASELFRINEAGNVGIGTTSPSDKLAIKDGALIFQKTSVNQFESGRIRFTESDGTSLQGSFIHYDGSTNILNIGVHSANNQVVGDDGNVISILRENGNVGIGTTSPDDELSVVGTVNATAFVCADGTNDCITDLIGTGDFVPYTGSTQNVALGAYNLSVDTSTLFVDASTNNVGIGTTSPYAYETTSTRFHVDSGAAEVARFEGESDADGAMATVRIGTSNDRGMYFEGGRTGAVAYGKIGVTDYLGAKTESIFIDSDGNVGIGTTSPDSTLHINASDAAKLKMTSNGNNVFYVRDAGVGDPGYLSLYDYGLENVRITGDIGADSWFNGGNVGIGTTEPVNPLDVEYGYAKTDTTNRGVLNIKSNEAYASDPFFMRLSMLGAATAADRTGIIQTGEYSVDNGGNLALQPYGGNVGIGTTSPSDKLHVNSSSARIGDSSQQSTKLYITSTNTAGAGAQTAMIQMEGYEGRGIGTMYKDATYSAEEWFAGMPYSGGFNNYQIGYDASGGQAEYQANVLFNVYHDGNVSAVKDFCISGGNCLSSVSEGLVDGTGEANRAAFWTDSDTLSYDGNFTWDNSNKRLGIGTDSPSRPLHVNDSSGSRPLILEGANSGKMAFLISDSTFAFEDASANQPIVIKGSGGVFPDDAIRIDTSGNVGIGTASPSSKLDVNGSLRVGYDSIPTASSIIRQGTNNVIFDISSGAEFTVTAGDLATERFTVDTAGNTYMAGNVGIGTTSPSEKLDVIGTGVFGQGTAFSRSTTSGLMVFENASTETSLKLWQAGRASAKIGSKADDSNFYLTNDYYGYGLGTANSSITLTNAGNVGIGTTSPTAKLDVQNGGVNIYLG